MLFLVPINHTNRTWIGDVSAWWWRLWCWVGGGSVRSGGERGMRGVGWGRVRMAMGM